MSRKFVISEEELKDMVLEVVYFPIKARYELLDNFLKSKKPVEEIASGEVVIVEDDEGLDVIIGEESLCIDVSTKIEKMEGKSIKIFILEE